ncbi:cadherin repeat domain-containing protein, partial [Microvirga brassicacearum]
TFTYTLTNDPDGKFQISGDQLQVKQGASLDYETKTQHTVTVRVTDQNGLFHDRTFTIAVNNLNETPGNQAPTDIGLSASAINENTANDVAVGNLSATDPNNGDTFTYALTDNAGGRFKLDATGTKILVANSALLNHESATSHQITIRVTDQGGLTHTKTITINVNNVNERPTDLNLSTQNVDENTPGGTSIGTLTGIDQDVGNTFTYTLMNDPDGKFQISGNQLQVKQGASLDYETKNQHTVTVRVTDQSGLFHDRTFTIAVNNLNET